MSAQPDKRIESIEEKIDRLSILVSELARTIQSMSKDLSHVTRRVDEIWLATDMKTFNEYPPIRKGANQHTSTTVKKKRAASKVK